MQLPPFSDKNSANMDDKAVRHKQAVPASSASPAPRELFPFVLGSEREVYQIFNYYVYDSPSINIVDLMNHLAFGGPPHK